MGRGADNFLFSFEFVVLLLGFRRSSDVEIGAVHPIYSVIRCLFLFLIAIFRMFALLMRRRQVLEDVGCWTQLRLFVDDGQGVGKVE